MERYRIALADDHALLRQGIRRILEEAPDIEVTGEAGDGAELVALLKASAPDMLILDVSMPNFRCIAAIHEIKKDYPDMAILVLTMHKEYLHQALTAGVDGYLLKEDADTELFSAIDNIRRGRLFVSPRLMGDVLRGHQLSAELLTAREKEVLKLLAEGKSNKEVADILFISVRTAESHRASISKKLDLKKPADLVRYAMQNGYI